MRFNHRGQHMLHRERLFAAGNGIARQPVGGGQNATQVIRGMTPFGGKPGIVKIQPANHRADIEGGLNRVQLKLRTRHLRAIRYYRARHDWPQ